ncbi:hypothetical protein GWI33_008239 [Rhynchophorus ferrugineus]|uniref:Probable ATP-dependent RNA helicase spindle-E n=1 Tax=Rhynchophorus ferrugineus TaxID=354439 RepID=A0A834MG15_RHYFE|nr:hypothetical protein GWI33_008239 [Rhynchophorus ferrugineus]
MKGMLELFDKKQTISIRRVNSTGIWNRHHSFSSDDSEDNDCENYEQSFVRQEMHRYHGPVREFQECYEECLSQVDSVNIDNGPNHFKDLYSKYSFKLPSDNKTELPIDSFKSQIITQIELNQVTVIEGPTGCGKTTQVPQMILDSCREKREYCHIIVTQPRRLAAINIAKRVCEERGWRLGTVCGYQVGLEKVVSPDQIITYVTTGVLLQKLIQAKNLSEYTHIIIDEVHERNQDLDFLLLVVRKYLFLNSQNTKVVLMSATINAEDFAFYFRKIISNKPISAPVIKVDQVSRFRKSIFYLDDIWQGSKTVPEFEIHKPEIFKEVWDMFLFLIEVFDKLDQQQEHKGSVLVFLPGINEIEEAHKLLISKMRHKEGLVRWEIIPLHSSLPNDEQSKVFKAASKGNRKIILSTNIAESSITVADTSYVIDFCQSKVMTLISSTNYTCLKLEWASHVNCDQRAGRVGRTGDGRVYRLVSKKFYHGHMTRVSKPEMQRAPLSQIVLQAKMLGLDETPSQILALAMEPPNLKHIRTTVLQLKQIGGLLKTCRGVIVKNDGDLTFLGRVMAALPIDVHLTKMIVLGQLYSCLDETIIIAAGCSIQNIFAIPFQRKLEAYKKLLLWADGSNSDQIAFLNLYTVWQNLRREGTFSSNRKELEWCQRNLVNLKGLREWQLLVTEIKQRLSKINIKETVGSGKVLLTNVEKPTVLKVVIAGAFYPHYFLKSRIIGGSIESNAVREVNGRNPFSTVYFMNMDSSQPGQIYVKQIKEMIQNNCERRVEMSVGFDCSTKLYVEFKDIAQNDYMSLRNNGTLTLTNMTGKIPSIVYEMVRQRHLRYQYTLKTLDCTLAWKFAEEHGLRRPGSWTTASEGSSKITLTNCFSDTPYNPIPDIDIQFIRVHISSFIDAGHFWVQNDDDITNQLLYQIEESLNRQRLIRLKELPKVGSIYATNYKEDGLYYRCKVLATCGKFSQVIFIDYGNKEEVETVNLYHLPQRPQCMVSPLAYECVLFGVKPSFRHNPSGIWSDSVNKEVHHLTDAVLLYAQVYSVVNDLVEVEVFRNEQSNVSLNQYLVTKGFAEPCNPSYLSSKNHEHREKVMSADSRKSHPSDNCDFPSPDLDKYNVQTLELRGPYSPLETKFNSCTLSTTDKPVNIEPSSVNVVLLDTEPDGNFSRLLVAAQVSQSSETGRLLLRQTTLMPNISGFPMLLAMIFCPTMEPKLTEDDTLVAGLLCGLGYDEVTKKSLFPSNDILLQLDTELTIEELEKVNKLRFLMNSGINLMSELEHNHLVGDEMIDIQTKVKEQLFLLINLERNLIKRSDVIIADETWGNINQVDLLRPSLKNDEQDIWRLLWFVKLVHIDGQQRAIIKNLQDIDNILYGASTFEPMECLLCQVKVYFIHELRLHVITSDHEENHFKFKKLGDIKDN